MAANRITLRIEGAEPGEERLWLADFLQELGALRTVLTRTEELITGQTVLDWQIVDLSKNSPATVSIEPVFAPPERKSRTLPEDRSADVVGGFFRYLRLLNASEAPPEMDRATLEAYQEFATPVRQRKLRATLSNGSETPVALAPTIDADIEVILAPTQRSEGTVKGRLEFLNIHAQQNVFRIYSPLIPRWVACHFPSKHLEEAKEAIGSKIRVSGEITYRTRDPYPQSIEVDLIEVLPEDWDLPTLLSLRGAAPDATGEMASEDFVRELRSGE